MKQKSTFTQKYFQAFSRIGVSTELKLFRMKGEKILSTESFDHADYDGISAVMGFAKSLSHDEVIPPKLSYSPPVSILKSIRELARWYSAFFPFKTALWKKSMGSKRVSAWARWEVENDLSSSDLIAALLLSLDQTSRNYLEDQTKPRMWMIPVGLYQDINKASGSGNSVSFIDVSIDNSTSTTSLKDQIRFYLKNGTHWGTLLTIKPVALLGVWLFSQLLKIAHLSFRRTGTLTNVGSWSVPGLAEDEWWVFGDGMAAKMNPAIATGLMVNGKLGVSIIFDSSLGKSKDEAEAFIQDWKSHFEKLVKK